MRIIQLYSILILCAIQAMNCQAANVCKVMALKTVPKLDGKITGDVAWDNIKWYGNFVKLGRDTIPSKEQTRFKVGYSANGLYIGIECNDNMAKAIKINPEAELWQQDNIEIFLMPDFKMIHLLCGVDGRQDQEINISLAIESEGLTDWKLAVKRFDERWEAEVFIPFCLLKVKPRDGLQIPFNVCKLTTSTKEASCWSPQSRCFHDPEGMGNLVFLSSNSNRITVIDKTLESVPFTLLSEKWKNEKRMYSSSHDPFYVKFMSDNQDLISELDRCLERPPKNNKFLQKYQYLKEKLISRESSYRQKLIGEIQELIIKREVQNVKTNSK